MKLLAGSGGQRVEGYISFDIRPLEAVHVCGALQFLPFADACFEEIQCHHTLEHLTPRAAQRAVAEFYRVLKTGEYITLTVPDLVTICVRYALEPKRRPELMRGFFGLPDKHEESAWAHNWGYERATLKTLMEGVGFLTIGLTTSEKLRSTPTLVYVGCKP